jgi:Cu-Zn family superoxide dismutase
MRILATLIFLSGASSVAFAQGTAPEESQLSVPIFAAGGKPAGILEMTDTPNGVLLDVTFEPGVLPAGEHAMHIHQVGDCSDVDAGFKKAGDHYNPAAAEHGFVPEGGPHAGDMPNMVIVDGQKTEVRGFNPMIHFSEGDAPLFDDDGSALVIHAKPDDYASQPSGEAGDRIACAELTAN